MRRPQESGRDTAPFRLDGRSDVEFCPEHRMIGRIAGAPWINVHVSPQTLFGQRGGCQDMIDSPSLIGSE